ncbi:MAG: LacI family DNA-binding transcriptional regulator [Victivallaceae bacterium]|nr:LacI family DNA-binding transcriptional regulator [Victivallaceae bacterium]
MTHENLESNPARGRRFVADYVRRKIRLGEYQPGQTLPRAKQLAEELGIHNNTVENGMRLLRKEKLVASRFGGGTVVRSELPESLKSVALLLPDTDSEHWRRVSKEIGVWLQCANWKLDIQQHHGNAWTFRKMIRELAAGHYSGAMISATPEMVNGYMPLAALVRDGFPVTFIGRGPDGADCWRVDDGDFAGGYHGTKHLIECRFKRIGLIGCPEYNGGEFIRGCCEALREFNGEPMAMGFAKDEKDALKLLKSWLEDDDIRLDSVFFHRVEQAQPAFFYLQSKRIQIGSDIGFITFDDTLFYRLTIPSPSAIRRYPERLGKRIADTFLAQLSVPFEQRNFAKTVEAQVGLEVGRTTGDRSARKVYHAIDPYGRRREYENPYGRRFLY